MRLIRFLAQVIDRLISLATLVFSSLAILPVLKQLLHNTVLSALSTLLTAALLAIAVQIPFQNVDQIAGKALFGLEVQSDNADCPPTFSILIQREIFCKLMSCYLICFPMLWGSPGGHETATETQVVRRGKSFACYKRQRYFEC